MHVSIYVCKGSELYWFSELSELFSAIGELFSEFGELCSEFSEFCITRVIYLVIYVCI